MLKKYWLGFIAFLTFLLITLSIYLFPVQLRNLKSLLDDTKLWLGWLLFALQYLYAKSERFYLILNNFRMWLTNESTTWTLTINFGYKNQTDIIENLSKIVKKYKPQGRIWNKSNDQLIFDLDGYSLRFFLASIPDFAQDDDSVVRTLCVQVSNLIIPYRIFKNKINNEIIPIIQSITEFIKPSAEKYEAKIKFSKINPYFGYFVRKLDFPNVVTFTCDILEYSVGGQEQNITIHKEHLEIVTNNLHALDILSQKYVNLSWG